MIYDMVKTIVCKAGLGRIFFHVSEPSLHHDQHQHIKEVQSTKTRPCSVQFVASNCRCKNRVKTSQGVLFLSSLASCNYGPNDPSNSTTLN